MAEKADTIVVMQHADNAGNRADDFTHSCDRLVGGICVIDRIDGVALVG